GTARATGPALPPGAGRRGGGPGGSAGGGRLGGALGGLGGGGGGGGGGGVPARSGATLRMRGVAQITPAPQVDSLTNARRSSCDGSLRRIVSSPPTVRSRFPRRSRHKRSGPGPRTLVSTAGTFEPEGDPSLPGA